MAKKIPEETDSSLSPAPEDLAVPTATETIKTMPNGKKRKAGSAASTAKANRTKSVLAETNGDEEEEVAPEPARKKRATAKKKTTYEEDADAGEGDAADEETEKPAKKAPRAAKKSKDAGPPLEERTVDTKLRVGAHVSIAGGVHNAIPNVLHIGANAFAIFLKNQRKWTNPPLDPAHKTLFLSASTTHSIPTQTHCVPHGSYLVNLAHPDPARKQQAYTAFHDDLTRCHALNIGLYNLHPGNANATTREEGIRLIASALNTAHADPATGAVVTLLETMASQGNTIGGTFEDLASIIALVERKDRVGVCLDTCHVFASGYDMRTPAAYAATMQRFDEVVGLRYLRALHVNDSKAPLGSGRDVHARIGTGWMGLGAFYCLVNDERVQGLPMVLETPAERVGVDGKKEEDKGVWAGEIKLLEGLVGCDVEGEWFREREERLWAEGEGERERVGGQVERRGAKGKGKGEGEVKPKKGVARKKAVKKGVEGEEEEEEGVEPKKAAPKRKAAITKKVESEEEEEDDE